MQFQKDDVYLESANKGNGAAQFLYIKVRRKHKVKYRCYAFSKDEQGFYLSYVGSFSALSITHLLTFSNYEMGLTHQSELVRDIIKTLFLSQATYFKLSSSVIEYRQRLVTCI